MVVLGLFCLLFPVWGRAAGDSSDASHAVDSIVNRYLKMADSARFERNITREFTAYSNLGQSYLMRDQYDSAFVYLSRAYGLWNSSDELHNMKNRRPVYMMFNCLAIHASSANMDYEKATEYLISGLTLAQQYPEDLDYAIMGKNLVTIFFIRQNPAGLKYAREIYRDGVVRENKFLRYIGAYGAAQMFCMERQYDSAYRYINEASRLEGEQGNSSIVYNIYADIFAGRNQQDSARYYYEKARQISAKGSSSIDKAYLCLSYGIFLRSQKKLPEAEKMLKQGLEYADESNNKPFLYRLYQELSNVYSDMGMSDKSLEYYKLYVSESEKIFSIKRERAINEMTFKYETERHKKEISEHRLMYLQRTHQLQMMWILISLVFIVFIIVYFMYRNKNRMYTKIVRQYKSALETENKLKSRITVLEDKLKNNDAPRLSLSESSENAAAIPDSAKDEFLFSELESVMKEQKLYRDDTLTREKLSEIIGTNRTYLSRVVSEKAGVSFNQYVNSYRIKEALNILSDPKNDTPLKALSAQIGFSSITTFYKVFQDEVGMTPARYRRKVQELS